MAKKKKKRPPIPRTLGQQRPAAGDWGYYLFRDFGMSVAYVANASESGSVNDALFAVDTWRDGLTACYGRTFETKEAFETEMQKRSELIKPSSRVRCREEIAYGLRIRLAADAEVPEEFERWRYLVDPLEEVKLPSYLYRCPDCGGGLPDEIAQQILSGIGSRTVYYFPCNRCKRNRPGRKSAQYMAIKQIDLMNAIEELDRFSVTWDQDNLSPLIRIPVMPNLPSAVRTMISEGEAMKAACMCIETHIACASLPNPIVSDAHVLNVLKVVSMEKPAEESEDDELNPTEFLVESIEDGIQMFNKVMRFRGFAQPHVNSALEWVMESVNTHHNARDLRAYIKFISRFVPV